MNEPDPAGMLLNGWTCQQLAHAIGDLRAAGDSCIAITSPHSLFSLIAAGTLTDAAIEVMKRWEELTGEDRPACDLPPKLQEMLQAQRVFRHVFEELKLGLAPTNNRKDQQTMDNLQPGTAPKVTPADIEAEIASEHYFTAMNGVSGANEAKAIDGQVDFDTKAPDALDLLTFCVLVLRNGFTVTGESACASPENFDAEVGRKIAREAAVRKMWPLMGFALRNEITGQRPMSVGHIERATEIADAMAEAHAMEPPPAFDAMTEEVALDPGSFDRIFILRARRGREEKAAAVRFGEYGSRLRTKDEARAAAVKELTKAFNEQQDAA